jgi:hypothetical protein
MSLENHLSRKFFLFENVSLHWQMDVTYVLCIQSELQPKQYMALVGLILFPVTGAHIPSLVLVHDAGSILDRFDIVLACIRSRPHSRAVLRRCKSDTYLVYIAI